jgi:two-component system cell cycle sensor histidine kinase/response regulator CckA
VPALPLPTSPDPLRAVPGLRPAWSGSEAKTREAQALEVVARLAGGVARDFNEYLTVIAGQAERALELVGPDHPARAALLEVQASGRAAAEATSDLLAISRRQVLSPQPVDLNSLVRGLVRTLPAALPAGVHARFDLSPMPLAIDVDAAQVTRAITNLVSFMADAMPTGGVITFGTKSTELGRARTVRLYISDTGPGLTEDLRARLFEPFVAATSRRKGLALTAAYGIVAQSGGGLSAESVPRGGTVFTMAWPASGQAMQAAAARTRPITAAD